MDNRSGKLGEDFTAQLLLEGGYELLARNYHSRWGELDIIARKGSYIVFVEVKTRRPSSLVHPLESVTVQKQEKIVKTALHFLESHPEYQSLQCRFDVAAVRAVTAKRMELEDYLENAF